MQNSYVKVEKGSKNFIKTISSALRSHTSKFILKLLQTHKHTHISNLGHFKSNSNYALFLLLEFVCYYNYIAKLPSFLFTHNTTKKKTKQKYNKETNKGEGTRKPASMAGYHSVSQEIQLNNLTNQQKIWRDANALRMRRRGGGLKRRAQGPLCASGCLQANVGIFKWALARFLLQNVVGLPRTASSSAAWRCNTWLAWGCCGSALAFGLGFRWHYFRLVLLLFLLVFPVIVIVLVVAVHVDLPLFVDCNNSASATGAGSSFPGRTQPFKRT